MSKKMLVPAVMSAFLLVTACSHKKHDNKDAPQTAESFATPVTQEGLTKMTETWPESSKTAISALTAKYGLPASVSEDMVVWTSSAPFKRSIVTKEEVNHQFPIQHNDVLSQSVDYRVPLDKVTALSKFDGSLMVDRTRGEITARNEKEEMNILSLNLADKIVRGEMTVEQARREYSKNAESFSAGTTSPMLTSLNFKSEGNTSDPDSMMQSQTESQPTIKKIKQSEEVIESEE